MSNKINKWLQMQMANATVNQKTEEKKEITPKIWINYSTLYTENVTWLYCT